MHNQNIVVYLPINHSLINHSVMYKLTIETNNESKLISDEFKNTSHCLDFVEVFLKYSKTRYDYDKDENALLVIWKNDEMVYRFNFSY